MKRILTTFIIAFMVTFTAKAQMSSENCKNFFSARAGVNFSKLVSDDYASDTQTGFNAAALYNISLAERAPLYLQTGLGINMKGARNSGLIDTYESTHFKSYAIELPVVVTYDIAINRDMAIVPEFGVFYSFAFTGSLEGGGEFIRPYKDVSILTSSDDIKSEPIFHRSDFGLRAGISFRYNACLIGFAYDAGLVNYFTKYFRDENISSTTGSWSVNLAYRFR